MSAPCKADLLLDCRIFYDDRVFLIFCMVRQVEGELEEKGNQAFGVLHVFSVFGALSEPDFFFGCCLEVEDK